MPTETARHYAEKVRDTLKAIAEADERNLDALTVKEFDAAKHELAAREARGLRAALLLHAASLAEAVLEEAESPTEAHYTLSEIETAMNAADAQMRGDDSSQQHTEYTLRHLSALRTASEAAPATRCGAEFAGHVCGLMHGHETSTKHWDRLTDMEWK
jgi:hypothetical protein